MITTGTAAEQILGQIPDWTRVALCSQTDPELFFPLKGDTRRARAICGRCDVKPECLEWALAHDERYGVWGGTTERQRKRMKHGPGSLYRNPG